MSHGYVNDPPGSFEFWEQFKCRENYLWRRIDYKPNFKERWNSLKWDIYGKQLYRFRMIKQLIKWKRNIKTLGKIHPNLNRRELESLLIQLQVRVCVKAVMGKE